MAKRLGCIPMLLGFLYSSVATADTATFFCEVIDRTGAVITNRSYSLPINERESIELGDGRHRLELRNHQNILLADLSLADSGEMVVRTGFHTVGSLQVREPSVEVGCADR